VKGGQKYYIGVFILLYTTSSAGSFACEGSISNQNTSMHLFLNCIRWSSSLYYIVNFIK